MSYMPKEPYHLHSTTPSALDKMRQHHQPYEVFVLGVPIRVLPGVWSPAYDWSGLYYAENLPAVAERDVLEVGCGSGVVSVFVARAGARRVVAVDVNPAAVECTRQNFQSLGLDARAESRVSDVFANIHDSFDVMIFNAPYHGCKPADLLERACADEDYRSLRTFLSEAKNHLKPGGLVSVGFSESGDLALLYQLISLAKFKIVRSISDWREDYNCMIFDMLAESQEA